MFGEVWEKFQQPVLSVEEQPKQKLDRRRRSRNEGGCIVSDVSYEEGRLLSAQKKVDEEKKKDAALMMHSMETHGDYVKTED